MEIDYIIVQAGGKGTRLQSLTRNKPKALVPVSGLPMIFHLFRKFPDKKFIIIADYKADVIKKYLAVFAEVQYIVVDGKGKKGTCGGLGESMKYVQNGQPFMLIWSDLVLPQEFRMPEEDGDYVGISKDFTCRWSWSWGAGFREIPSSDEGVAGLFIFKDKSGLIDVPAEGEFVRWLSGKEMDMKAIPLYSTKEYGLLSEYKKLTEEWSLGSRCRPFNQIEIVGDRLVKKGIDAQGRKLAVREAAWYKAVAEKGLKAVPYIYSYDPLVMQRIKGANIFEYDLSASEQKSVLGKLVNSLREIHSLGSVPVDYFSIREAYVGKTFTRLEKVRNLIPFADREYIVINGKPCRNVFFYRKELEKLFESYTCGQFELIHGDNTFSNILLDENMTPVFIDPRGYFGYTEIYGDPNYDWAKLYYSIVGNYDQFNLKHFSLSVNEDDIELEIQSNGWEQLEDYYFGLLGDDVDRDGIKLIHAVIWLSLTTYAWEDYDSICGAFYNGLLYLEDIFVKYLDGPGKESAAKLNLTFDGTMKILTDSCRSVDETVYSRLLDECEETLRSGHKIITSGLGKNVPVCEKFTGSMLSMGLDAGFLHTSNAVHGDLGMVKSGDLVIILSKSGSTSESVYLVEQLEKKEDVNLWLLTFKRHSVLGERLKALAVDLEHEGDLWNIMPNNSTILNLIILQSLAINLAKRLKLTLEADFKPNHPGGAIGSQLK